MHVGTSNIDPSLLQYQPWIVNEVSLCPLHHAVTRVVLCRCNPPPRGISYTQSGSERWVHTCTSAPGNASPQRSRKGPSEGFIQRCSALGGNRLHWWLIYRINTKGIGFLSHFSLSLSFPVTFSLSEKHESTQWNNPWIFFSPVKSCFSASYISPALLSSWLWQLKWKDVTVFKCLNTWYMKVEITGKAKSDLATLAPSVSTALV